jgi:hypothetical protein
MRFVCIRASPTPKYFRAVNVAASPLESYTAWCALFSSIGGGKLQRKRQGKNGSSSGRSKLQRAAPAQTTYTHYYAFNKIKQASKIHE